MCKRIRLKFVVVVLSDDYVKGKKFRERNIPTGSQFPSASNSRGPQNVALQLFISDARYPVDNLRPGFVFFLCVWKFQEKHQLPSEKELLIASYLVG